MTREILQQHKVNGVLYRQIATQCGNHSCKCRTKGEKHGPYWYGFDGSGGTPKYWGKNLPAAVTDHIKLKSKAAAKIKRIEEESRRRMEKHQEEADKARRELRTLQALKDGDYAAAAILESIGLSDLVVKVE